MRVSWRNILDEAAAVVTPSYAATGYDGYRLYDRIPGRQWKSTVTTLQGIMIDQGAAPIQYDTVIVPSGHLLSGCNIQVFYADSDSGPWSALVTQWNQSGSGEIFKQSSSVKSNRWVYFQINGASVPPQMGELWVGLMHTFTSGMTFGTEIGLDPARVVKESIYSKTRHTMVFDGGNSLISAQVKTVKSTERAYFEDWFAVAEVRPLFYLVDYLGVGRWMEFVEQPKFSERENGLASVQLLMRQVW